MTVPLNAGRKRGLDEEENGAGIHDSELGATFDPMVCII